MRKLLILVLLATSVASMAADKPRETIEELQTRAAGADKKKQVDLYMDIAQRELESANDVYNNNADQAKKLFEQAGKSAVTAAQAALDSNHKLKQTEIRLRELSFRMSDIRKTWAFE